ncbi:transcription antitermination factor NusB [Helicobacter trogontum]|uniref:Transcription antitermination protein NusB n=1 Tax=Helicobacter trogontum TaxID=50960 RepID=A0A4V6I348_9HELI|nr:transcription antitermination factor NusB [Helicobacter trogontum]MDY5185522.1 transcription antitermination factor NusB [Helicobacter trogontum]TLD98562.1 transcription antitermination factor NusB [Helicobacter trogontum]
MATRKQAREAVIQILYAKELGNDKAIEQAESFLYEQKIRNKQQDFALTLLHGICSEEKRITDVINVFLKTWDLSRLGVIEKNIIKLGVYELLQTNTQKAVVINEAIELTKSFNVQDAFRLVNGILDSVAKADPKMLDDLIQQQVQTDNINAVDQKPISETHTESKKIQEQKPKNTQYLKKDATKKTRPQADMQKAIKVDSIQNSPTKKTDIARIKSIQINVNVKSKEQQNLEKKTHMNKKSDSKRSKDFERLQASKKSSQFKKFSSNGIKHAQTDSNNTRSNGDKKDVLKSNYKS